MAVTPPVLAVVTDQQSPAAANVPIYDKEQWDSPEPWPWERPIVLSLDGGGVRGYASLLILDKLMDKVEAAERYQRHNKQKSSATYCWSTNSQLWDRGFRPCHYMDYMFGTSTGGLSAIMLGRLNLTVKEAMKPYELVGETVFAKRHHFTGDGHLRDKYSSEALEKVLIDITAEHAPKSEERIDQSNLERASDVYLANDEWKTRTAVVAYSLRVQKEQTEGNALLYRSYRHHPVTAPVKKPFDPPDVPLYKVAMATCAAPRFFHAVHINDNQVRDGALANENNPVRLAFEEVKNMQRVPPKIIVSIGTGQRRRRNRASPLKRFVRKLRFFGLLIHFYEEFKEAIRDSHRRHVDFESEIQRRNDKAAARGERDKISYYRFDIEAGESGLQDVRLGDWHGANGTETKAIIRKAVDDYVGKDAVEQQLEDCADELVRIRHCRQRTSRWEEFAVNVKYRCLQPQNSTAEPCKKNFTSGSRSELKKHLEKKHGIMCEAPRFSVSQEQKLEYLGCKLDGHGGKHQALFHSETEYLDHLRNEHGLSAACIIPWQELEMLLDQAREEFDPRESVY